MRAESRAGWRRGLGASPELLDSPHIDFTVRFPNSGGQQFAVRREAQNSRGVVRSRRPDLRLPAGVQLPETEAVRGSEGHHVCVLGEHQPAGVCREFNPRELGGAKRLAGGDLPLDERGVLGQSEKSGGIGGERQMHDVGGMEEAGDFLPVSRLTIITARAPDA